MGGKSSAPETPDYRAAAEETAAGNLELLNQQTVNNRPTQNTPWGQSKWVKDADGNWTQDITLDPAEQARLDQQRMLDGGMATTATGLLGKVNDNMSRPIDLSGLPTVDSGNYRDLKTDFQSDLSGVKTNGTVNNYDTKLTGQRQLDAGFGAVEQVRDAMMSRMAPERAQQREAELQRLRNQGLSDNSEAFQRAVKRLDEGDTDANQQALLGAASEYGNIFSRGLQANQQEANNFEQQFRRDLDSTSQADARLNSNNATALAVDGQKQSNFASNYQRTYGANAQDQSQRNLAAQLRQQAIAEQDMIRQSPLNDLMKLRGQNVTNPNMPSFVQAGNTQGADYSGAATNQYNADMAKYNASQSSMGGMMGGLMGLGGSVLQSSGGLQGLMALSDRRLKSNVVAIGKYRGHKWYMYTKFDNFEIGVMAQDLQKYKPEAVHTHESGYLMVDYGAL